MGDNASPLHLAVTEGSLESARLLLDAGADVQGLGDHHGSGVIGWATCLRPSFNLEIVALLLARGARHHIFSAVAVRDIELVQDLVEETPDCLAFRRSRFEQHQTPLHVAVAAPDGLEARPPHVEMVELLIELGADLEAEDDKGRTPLAVAMMRGDRETTRRLRAAGAKEPDAGAAAGTELDLRALGVSVPERATPMLRVPDVSATAAWYQSIGFELQGRHPADGPMDWAKLSFGRCEMMLTTGEAGSRPSLWVSTTKIDEIYRLLKARQLSATDHAVVRFEEDLYEPFYGGRQFTIRDNDGVALVFVSS
jgi:catechol 2,3-dioxygenase-like lactoylglutathione lyase family enzyme